MSGDVLHGYTEQVRDLLEQRLRIKGPTLARKVSRLGRSVPRSVRKDAEFLVKAAEMGGHPKLAHLVNDAQVRKAGDNVIAHLQTIDPREAAKDRTLWILAKVSGFVIVVFVGLIWVAWDRGLI